MIATLNCLDSSWGIALILLAKIIMNSTTWERYAKYIA